MATDAYVFSRQAIEQLRADHFKLAHEIQNLKARGRGVRDTPASIAGYRFKNAASETAPAYGVMRITAFQSGYDSFYTITKPDTTFDRLYLVNGQNDVSVGAYGFGFLLEESDAIYDVATGTPAIGEGWGPKPSQWSLAKGFYGFTILGGNAGTGSGVRTRIQQHLVHDVIGKTDASHAKSASGTVSVYAGATKGSESDTGMNLTAWNRYAAVGSGKWVDCTWVGNGFDATAAEC